MKFNNDNNYLPKPTLIHQLILSIILLFVIGLRLQGIANPVYDYNAWRQTETAALAYNYYTDSPPFLYPEIDWVGPNGHAEMEFPLFPYIVSWFYVLFGAADLWGRLLSVLCTLGVVWAMFDITRRTTHSVWGGLFAAALFTVSPLAIFFGRTFQPDMMMVMFSTLSISALLRWNGSINDKWLYLSGILLALGVLLKPNCLIVAFPLLWIFWQHKDKQVIFAKEGWVYLFIVVLPAFFWYSHAHEFYKETQATFMWHYKNFAVERTFFHFWKMPEFWNTVWLRVYDQILVIIGMIPFMLALVRVLFPHPARGFVWSWLFGMGLLYIATPEHHLGHDYYSLLAIPPAMYITAIGCLTMGKWIENRIAVSPGIMLIIPLAMGIFATEQLEKNGWYNKIYQYYDDAIDLKERLPHDDLILVMDDILHTPEFFYFSDKVGWHRYRNLDDWFEDSVWVETYRQKGASYFIGLTENTSSNPIKYLLNHPMGQYMRSHYQLMEIGKRYYIANLNEPKYGDHLFMRYPNQPIAVSDNLLKRAKGLHQNVLPIDQWQNADVIIINCHQPKLETLRTDQQIYSQVIAQGFRVVGQNSARLVLEKNPDIEAIPNLMDTIILANNPSRIQDNHQVKLGLLEPGRYRVSFKVDHAKEEQFLVLNVFDLEGNIIARREIKSELMPQVREGEAPELFFELSHYRGVMASVDAPHGAIKPQSVVCMPDVICIQPHQVIEAEHLITYNAERLPDPSASRKTSLRNIKENYSKVVTIGPYFEFPSGKYEFVYRLRAGERLNNQPFKIGMYRSDESGKIEKEIPLSQLGLDYADFTVQGELHPGHEIESRLYIPENVQLWFDTVTYKQLKNGIQPNAESQHLIAAGDQVMVINDTGMIYNLKGEKQTDYFIAMSQIKAAAWSPAAGPIVIDDRGRVYDQNHQQITSMAPSAVEDVVAVDISPDGSTIGTMNASGYVFLSINHVWHGFQLPERPYPPRDLLVTNGGGAIVLFGNGELYTHGSAQKPEGIPDFFSDVARALIRYQEGVYVVDANSGIHTSNGVPPVQTPIYSPEQWVKDAIRTQNGTWVMHSIKDESKVFEEKKIVAQ